MAVKFLNGIDVDGSMNIAASDVPNLDASKITSGTLSADRIPNLSGTYQPAGDYLTLETAETSFQPIGNYLTSVPAEYLTQTEGDARYLQTYDGLQSSHVTGALGYTPYKEGTDLSAYTITFANIEKTNVDLDGEMGWDANDTEAPVTLGTYGGSYPDGLYLRGSGTLYTVYHTGHFTGTHISNWQKAYGWGNHASAGYLTSLPSHNHDTLYDTIGSADAVNARIDNEVFPALDDLGNAIPTNNNQLTNGAGYITDLPDAGVGAGTYGSTSNQVKIDTITVDAKGRVTAVATGTGGDITTVRLVDDSGSYVQDTGGTAVLTIAGGEGISTSASGTTITITNDWGNHASAGYLTSIPSTYATDAEVSSAVGAIEASINERIDTEVIPSIPTNNNQLTNGAGYITSFDITTQTDGKYLRSNADDSFSGNLTSAQSKWIKFYHPTQTDSNDGKIGAGVFDTGLNIVGVQTVAGTGRQVRVWGDLITSTGTKYATTGYVDTAVSNLVDSAPGALNTLNELAAALGDDANFSTTVTNNIGAVNERIDTEVFDAINAVAGDAAKGVTAYGWGNHAGLYLGATAKAADSNLLDGINSTSFLRSDVNDTHSGTLALTGITAAAGTISNDKGSYLHLGSWAKGRTDAGAVLVNTAYRADYATNLWNENISRFTNDSGYTTEAYADAAANAAREAVNTRIDGEVLPIIPTNNNQLTNGAGYITGVPSSFSTNSITIGSGVTLRESTDRSDLLSINSGTGGWGGLQITNNNGDGIWSFMVDGSAAGIYDDQNGDWAVYCIENSYVELRHNGSGKLATNSGGVTVTGTVTATGGNSGNWNTAYGWGNHASAGYLKSIPSDYVRQGTDIVSGNIHPVGDRQQLLGLEENRWKIVFCEILDSAGQHEKNLQNPEGEKSVGDYPTGTVLVWKDGKNIPCTESADHMRMGIAVQGVASPLIQGAEPVLVTGTVNEGDYLVTSSVEGHAEAISPQFMRQHGLYDCVLGKALESGEGESYLLKTWINI